MTAALLACVAGGSCDSRQAPAAPIAQRRTLPADTEWYRSQLVDGDVAPRLRNSMTDSGFYRPFLASDWTPLPEQRATLVSQSRAIYLMAAAYEVSGEAAYMDAMVKAADFLLAHFPVGPEPGVFVSAVAPDGTVVDRGYHAYGHAQALFGLAHAYRYSKHKKYLDAALGIWMQMDVPRLVEGRHPRVQALGLNMTMHLFEALLALYRTEGSKLVYADLQRLADYIVAHYFDAQRGFFYEELDPSLRPAKDGAIRLGHNIEMAFLLSRGVAAGLPAKYLDTANRTVDFVVRYGVDRKNSSLPHELNYDGTVRDAQIPLWCQTELLRGLAHFARARGRSELLSVHDAALAFAKTHFIDPRYRGWYELPDRPDTGKGNDWDSSYHLAMMLTEELRLRGFRFQSGDEMLL